MKLEDLIASFRVDTQDVKKPYLWPDKEIARWLAEGEDEAAIRKRLLFDSDTPAVTEIEVLPGTTRYKLDTRIFEVTGAWLYNAAETQRTRLTPTDMATVNDTCPFWRTDRGMPERIVIEDSSILLPYLISEPWLIRLEGYRTPLEPLTNDSPDAEPEIASVHHRFLVYWALHRAYQKPDAETLNPSKSATALEDFEAYFGKRLTANQGKRNQADRPHRVRAYW